MIKVLVKNGISKSTTTAFSVIIHFFFCSSITCYTRFSFQSLRFKFCISGSKTMSAKWREAAASTPLRV